MPLPEHAATGRLVYLETDPVELRDRAARQRRQAAIEFLEPHCAFFTWGENYGHPDCGVPDRRALPVPADAAAGRHGLWRSSAERRRRHVHHHRQLAAALARGRFKGERLPLEQAPRVPEVPRSARPKRPPLRAGA